MKVAFPGLQHFGKLRPQSTPISQFAAQNSQPHTEESSPPAIRVHQVILLAATVFLATANAASESGPTTISTITIPDALTAEGNNNVARRLLRSETTTDAEEEKTAADEERVLRNTAAAKKLIPKLEKALSNKELLAPPQKESARFALWFIKGQGPSYVAKYDLKVNPLASTGKAIAVYYRYVAYFQKYVNRGIKFHLKN